MFLFSVAVLVASFGMLRYNLFTQDHGDRVLQEKINQKIIAEGIVVEEPDERDTSLRLIINLINIVDKSDKEIPLSQPTKIIASDQAQSTIQFGDLVHIEGKLVVPENFIGDTGNEFDYVHYLAKDKIFYEIKNPVITFRKSHQGNSIKEKLFLLKHFYVSKLDELISFPESRLGAGLTVAGKRALPKNIQNDFQASGTLQVVVLSGYNVTIIAEAIEGIFSFMPTIFSSVLGILCIILFSIMTGGSATIVRGSIMAIVVIIGSILRRRYNVLRSLVTTALVMLILNPMLLMFDPSFELSFLATLGLIVMSPYISKYLQWIPEKNKMREVCAATLSAQIFVSPFLIWSSHQLSLVSLPANFLLSLAVPTTMLLCFITGMLGMVVPILAIPSAWLSSLLLMAELNVVHFFAVLPFANITLPYFPTWCMVLVYSSYGVILYRLKAHETKNGPTIHDMKNP